MGSNIHNKLINVLLFLSFLLLMIGNLEITSTTIGERFLYYQFSLASIIHLVLYKDFRRERDYHFFIRMLLVFFVFGFINYIFVNNILSIKSVLYTVLLMSSITGILYFYRVNTIIAWLIFIIPVVFYSNTVLVSGPSGLDEVMVMSSNYVSYYMLLFSFPLFVAYKNNNSNIPILPAVVIVFFSVLAFGRGGIMWSMFLLASMVYLKMNKAEKHRFLYRFLFSILVFGVLFVGISPQIMESVFGKFLNQGFETARGIGWLEYIDSIEIGLNKNFLLGSKITPQMFYLYNYMGESLHNSYLAMHSRSGILVFWVLYMLIGGMVRIYKVDKYEFFLLLCLLMKDMSDVSFPFYSFGGDIYVLYIILKKMSYDKKINYES